MTRTATAELATVPEQLPDDTRSGVRVEALDGLRTVAIAFVLLYHLHIPFFTGGFIGVNVFFALSGYLITSILLVERKKTGSIHLGRFWLNRLIRLYPALLALVIVSVCVWFLVSDYEGANVDAWGAALLALTYTSNIGRWLWHKSIGVLAQTWSLGMEEQFYLVWPPALALLGKIRARRTLVLWSLGGLVVVSAIASWLLYRPHSSGATPDVYFSPVLDIGPLLCGVILAILLTDDRARRAFAGTLGAWCTWGGAAAIVAIEVAMTPGWQHNAGVFAVILPLTGIVSALFIGALVTRPSIVARALSLRPIAWFGQNASYSLYLWHVLVLALVLPIVPGVGGTLTAILAAVLVAIGSHFAIEKPFGRLRNRLRPAAD